MKKLSLTDPTRKIERADINQIILEINTFIETFESETTQLTDKIDRSNKELEKKTKKFQNKLDGFYSRQIEIFGIFIGIFSFIIAGIQISINVGGNFWEKLLSSAAIFIPILICIFLFMLMVKWIIRK